MSFNIGDEIRLVDTPTQTGYVHNNNSLHVGGVNVVWHAGPLYPANQGDPDPSDPSYFQIRASTSFFGDKISNIELVP